MACSKCLELTHTLLDIENKRLNNLELRIILVLAIVKINISKLKESNTLLLFIKTNLLKNGIYTEESKQIYIKCLCNISYNYYLESDFSNSLKYADEGINYCLSNMTLYLLHFLYVRKSIAKLLLGKKNFQKDIKRCIVLLEILNMDSLKEQYIKVFKNKYDVNILNELDNILIR